MERIDKFGQIPGLFNKFQFWLDEEISHLIQELPNTMSLIDPLCEITSKKFEEIIEPDNNLERYLMRNQETTRLKSTLGYACLSNETKEQISNIINRNRRINELNDFEEKFQEQKKYQREKVLQKRRRTVTMK